MLFLSLFCLKHLFETKSEYIFNKINSRLLRIMSVEKLMFSPYFSYEGGLE